MSGEAGQFSLGPSERSDASAPLCRISPPLVNPDFIFLIDGPFTLIRWERWMIRSRSASAIVGSGTTDMEMRSTPIGLIKVDLERA